MIIVNKQDLDSKLNHLALKRGDKIEIEIADVNPMGLLLDPKTIKLDEMRDPEEAREPLTKAPKAKSMAQMPLPDLKNMIQNPMPAVPVAPSAAPVPPAPII